MAVTVGSSLAPSQETINFDALWSQSLAACKKQMTDNIASSNAFFHEIMKRKLYQSEDGGTQIEENLLYELSQMDWYSGYDELPSTPIDGVTKAIFMWAQAAVPISYNMKEVRQNAKKITDLVKTKMKQATLGFQEGWSQALMWGGKPTGGNLYTVPSSPINGSVGINPLPLLIMFDPTVSVSLGNINQNTYTWWRNKTKDMSSGITTYDGLVYAFNNIFNTVSLGTGGQPDTILVDQTTFELLVQAYWIHYRKTADTDASYPFTNILWRGARIVMDEKVPDVKNDGLPVNGVLTAGTAFLINSDFMKVRYDEERNFDMLTDEHGKAFQKPVNQDARLGHLAWMGQTTENNRRKQGVAGGIPRTLTA